MRCSKVGTGASQSWHKGRTQGTGWGLELGHERADPEPEGCRGRGGAAYSPDTDRCYLIHVEETEGHVTLSLRLTPTRNNQVQGVRWAHDYKLGVSLERHWAAGARQSGMERTRPGR
jgi:hypothetical protein